jgi:predicted HTH domain antitoxin
MKTVVLEYPESLLAALSTDASHFAQETKMAAAMKLFERGRFSSGQAANFAGVSRAKFLISCGEWGVSSLGPWDEEEIEREFTTLLPGRP